MCELLALSTSHPASLTFSLHALAARGGLGSSTRDGWGVAFYQGDDVALFREPAAAGDSALVRFLEMHSPPTTLAVSHIRHATQGTVRFANTQPFMRELGGRTHVFAHNGDLVGIAQCEALALGTYRPVGQTDSEHAFCALMARLQTLWTGSEPPLWKTRLAVVSAFAADLRALGPANFLYSDGDVLFAHGHRRKQAGAARADPPGLWALQRHCDECAPGVQQASGVTITSTGQTAILFASVPLSGEAWRALGEGELLAVRNGQFLGE